MLPAIIEVDIGTLVPAFLGMGGLVLVPIAVDGKPVRCEIYGDLAWFAREGRLVRVLGPGERSELAYLEDSMAVPAAQCMFNDARREGRLQ